MKPKGVEEYIGTLSGWQAEVVAELRSIVLEAAPGAEESFKWAQPVYDENGPFCYIKAFKKSVNLGFWRGVDLADPEGILKGSGEKMRHVPLTSVQEIRRELFQGFVREAVALNQLKGDPTKGS
jgi:hypothetical protein